MATLASDFYWLFLALAAVIAVLGGSLIWRAILSDRSRGRRRCPKCWYEMTGVPGLRCPECGSEAKTERVLFRTRRRLMPAAAGLALILIAAVTAVAPRVWEKGWLGAIPNWALIPAMWVTDTEGHDLFCEYGTRSIDPTKLPHIGRSMVLRTAVWHVRHGGLGPPRALPRGTPGTPFLSGIPIVGQTFRTTSSDSRVVGLEVLSALGTESRPHLPVIVRALASDDIRSIATAVANGVATTQDELLGVAVPMLGDADLQARIGAVRAIAGLGAGGTPAMESVIHAMRTSPAPFAENGFQTLEALGASPDVVLRVVSDPLVPERAPGFTMLYHAGPDSCEMIPAPLRILANDGDAQARHGAAELLGYFDRDADTVVPALARAFRNDPSGRVRNTSLWAFHKMSPDRAEVTGALIRALSDPHADVRFQALRLLAFDGVPSSAMPTVRAMVKDPDRSVVWAAGEAVKTLSP